MLASSRARLSAATLFRLGVMACVLLTFGLGFLLWDRFPLREDEAIYAYWALHFAKVDPWFLTVWPDKPPLFLWSLAGIFELMGPSPVAARFLNIATTALTVPVVAAIARRLWGRSAGLWAAVTFALNPFVLSFAPTVYTDPMLVLWGMIALYTALSRRPFWAGIFLGAAIMTKQQGVLFVPLVGAALFFKAKGNAQRAPEKAKGKNGAETDRSAQHATRNTQHATHTLLGLATIILPIIFWDSRRWAVAPSPWDLAVGNYGGLGLLPVDQWISRWQEWAGLLWRLGGSWGVWVGLGLGISVVLFKAKDNAQRAPEKAKGKNGVDFVDVVAQSPIPNPQPLILWTAAFLAFHLFTTIQPWDRYWLPLAPMLALLVGWMGHRLTQLKGRRIGAILGLAWILLLLPPGISAAQGGAPLGGDHGDYAGFDTALAWFQTHAPADAVLYHQELGWQYKFYLFGQDQADEGGYDLRWTPSAVYLADNAAKIPQQRKFLIQPEWAATRDQARYLPMRGMTMAPRFHAHKFTVYEIITVQPPGGAP